MVWSESTGYHFWPASHSAQLEKYGNIWLIFILLWYPPNTNYKVFGRHFSMNCKGGHNPTCGPKIKNVEINTQEEALVKKFLKFYHRFSTGKKTRSVCRIASSSLLDFHIPEILKMISKLFLYFAIQLTCFYRKRVLPSLQRHEMPFQ